jgi:hypothetical protein
MNDNRFSNGLLLGLIIGGGAVFLLGTKKGKKLLREFSESGMEGLNDILEEIDLEENFEKDPLDEVVEEVTEVKNISNNDHVSTEEKEKLEEIKGKGKKRFFKRPSR